MVPLHRLGFAFFVVVDIVAAALRRRTFETASRVVVNPFVVLLELPGGKSLSCNQMMAEDVRSNTEDCLRDFTCGLEPHYIGLGNPECQPEGVLMKGGVYSFPTTVNEETVFECLQNALESSACLTQMRKDIDVISMKYGEEAPVSSEPTVAPTVAPTVWSTIPPSVSTDHSSTFPSVDLVGSSGRGQPNAVMDGSTPATDETEEPRSFPSEAPTVYKTQIPSMQHSLDNGVPARPLLRPTQAPNRDFSEPPLFVTNPEAVLVVGASGKGSFASSNGSYIVGALVTVTMGGMLWVVKTKGRPSGIPKEAWIVGIAEIHSVTNRQTGEDDEQTFDNETVEGLQAQDSLKWGDQKDLLPGNMWLECELAAALAPFGMTSCSCEDDEEWFSYPVLEKPPLIFLRALDMRGHSTSPTSVTTATTIANTTQTDLDEASVHELFFEEVISSPVKIRVIEDLPNQLCREVMREEEKPPMAPRWHNPMMVPSPPRSWQLTDRDNGNNELSDEDDNFVPSQAWDPDEDSSTEDF